MNPENSQTEISELLDAHQEWLLVEQGSNSFTLRRDEMEIIFERRKLLFAFLDEKGFQTWRIAGWKCERGRIHFDLTRNFGKEHRKVALVSRVLAAELNETIEHARIEKAKKIANLIVETGPKTKLVSARLNRETGRFAQIVFENPGGKQMAALADVSDEATPEKLLTTGILWLEKLQGRKKNRVEKVRILAEKKVSQGLAKLHALLRKNWKSKIEIFEIPSAASDAKAPGELRITNCELQFADLWNEKPKKIQSLENTEISETAQKIISLSPTEIDVVFTNRGETLRYLGLPFARVRKIFGQEKTWFGTGDGGRGGRRQLLNEETFESFLELIENLKIYRRFDSANKRHAFYQLAPESWLEAILRRNVRRLDANLILSPIHNQFRVSNDQIDLLALRRDGRLAVIELKTSPDREMIFQAADYWRKIELQRLSGVLQKAGIFGDAKISNQTALVYLVAPMLSFHRDFEFLAQTVSPEIEIARFCLNENWRESLKVVGREAVSNTQYVIRNSQFAIRNS